MTTRAGLVGLGVGLLLSGVLFYPLYLTWPAFFINDWPGGSWVVGAILVAVAAALTVCGGGLAAAWSGATQARPRLALGALAGGTAALVVFCSLGAAAGGMPGLGLAVSAMLRGHFAELPGREVVVCVVNTVQATHGMFWALALSGVLLGALGGWGAGRAKLPALATLSEDDPMMALNTTITAFPAAAFAVILAAALFSRLPELLQRKLGQTEAALSRGAEGVLDWPLLSGLLLYLGAQLALMLATQYEGQRSKHRCGTDEVKMAAYVGIFVPLLVLAALGLIDVQLMFRPWVSISLLLTLWMAERQVFVLYTLILPRRAAMPPPGDALEAALFGTIAGSRWRNLSLLCLGCGILMAAPTYITVAAATLNVALLPIAAGPALTSVVGWTAGTAGEAARRMYAVQFAAGLGACAAAALALMGVYGFYLGLGRWVRKKRLG